MNEHQQALETMRETPGYSEFYEFGCRLAALAKQKKENGYDAVLIPNLFVETPVGFSPKEFIHLLSELVYDLRLKTPVGEETYIIEVYKDDESSLKSLVNKLHQAAGFYGEFNGFVGLQIETEADIHQLKYLFQLVETQPKMTFVFFVSNTSDERARKKLEIELMRRVNLHQMKIDGLNPEQMTEYLEARLDVKGYSITAEARESLQAALRELKKSSCFGGYKTLNQLVDHIIWNLIDSTSSHRTISTRDLSFLFERRGFLDSFQEQNTRCIGFGEKG